MKIHLVSGEKLELTGEDTGFSYDIVQRGGRCELHDVTPKECCPKCHSFDTVKWYDAITKPYDHCMKCQCNFKRMQGEIIEYDEYQRVMERWQTNKETCPRCARVLSMLKNEFKCTGCHYSFTSREVLLGETKVYVITETKNVS